jgi:hypothetical protein
MALSFSDCLSQHSVRKKCGFEDADVFAGRSSAVPSQRHSLSVLVAAAVLPLWLPYYVVIPSLTAD